MGRQTEASNWWGNKASTYDAAGRRISYGWVGLGLTVNTDYDVTGNVVAIRENGATSGVGVLATYAYDNLGRRTSLSRGNGTVTSWSYDAIGRLASLSHNLGGAANDVSTSFGYNPASQIASSTRDNDSYAWSGHYNRNTAETPNGLNQLVSQGSTSLGHDARGNVSAIGAQSYVYTAQNLLASAPGGAAFIYNPHGQTIIASYGLPGETRFDYDGDALIAELSSGNVMLRRYVHGPGVDEPLVWYEGSGTSDRRWLHADERGSIVAISDASGNAITINKYDEYGQPAATNLSRFGYTSQTWLPELQMWNYKARIYDPKLGRFMQTDPIGYADGINWYNYVDGDPVNGVDPTGTSVRKRQWKSGSTGSRIVGGCTACSGNWGGFSSASGLGSREEYEDRINAQLVQAAQNMIGLDGNISSCAANASACIQLTSVTIAIPSGEQVLGGLKAGVGRALGLLGAILSMSGDSNQVVPLFRAVGPRELVSIIATGQFSLGPSGFSQKQFFFSLNDARWFGAIFAPSTIVSTRVTPSTLALGFTFPDAGRAAISFEGAGIVALNKDAARYRIRILESIRK